MTRILAFAGAKQAGKTTAANFVHGYQLRANGVVNNFHILENGNLAVTTVVRNESDKESEETGVLDIHRNDIEFAEWASYNMWPYVKVYSFASILKDISVNLFGLKRENVYGDNTMKNIKTQYRWEDMPSVISDPEVLKSTVVKRLVKRGKLMYHDPGRMTHREFLQFFGTQICRRVYDEIWHEITMSRIALEQPLVAVIDDCRFINEVDAIQQAGGKVISLLRNPYDDDDVSENELKTHDNFDRVIDNTNLNIHETNIEILKAMNDWNWLGEEVKPETIKPENTSGIHTFRKV